MREPYFIEVDHNGCATCGHDRSWTVVGPDGTAEGQSWGDEESASDWADAMNRAYYVGARDANLHTAAPELLKALQSVRRQVLTEIKRGGGIFSDKHLAMMNSAIRKAKTGTKAAIRKATEPADA